MVTAKPFTGPVPMAKRIPPTSKVVRLESRIAVKARPKPSLIARCTVMPAAISSRIREKISTLASTAIPMVRTIPAIPGRVSVAPSSDIKASSITMFTASATVAMMPKKR
ncbi:hypothetical protein D3C84_1129510 [compost metagenome]